MFKKYKLSETSENILMLWMDLITDSGVYKSEGAHTYSFSLATSGVFLFSHSLCFLLTPAFESEGQDHLRETGLPDV